MNSINASKITDWVIEMMTNLINIDIDEDIMTCYNITDGIDDILTELRVNIENRLTGNDKVIRGEIHKHLMVRMRGVYMKIDVEVFANEYNDSAIDFKFKKIRCNH